MEKTTGSTGSWETRWAHRLSLFPSRCLLGIADSAFRTLMYSMGGCALATLTLLDLAIVMIVIRPVTKLSNAAHQISKGDLGVPELAVKGRGRDFAAGAIF